MFSKALPTVAVAVAASTLVSAQTSSLCNPLKKTCPFDPGFNSKVTCDFSKGDCDIFKPADGTKINHNGKGAVFQIKTEKDAPTIHTSKYIFFGEVDVEVQAAAGQGIVTSAVLQSDDLDEIDWEWVGGDNAQVQTNYFSKGDTTTYDRGAYHPVDNPTGQFHKYSIKWTPEALVWSINGSPVRTLTYQDAKGGSTFPQTPMQVKLGTWVGGGEKTQEGTVKWAGGYTDFSKAPFLGYYKSITIVDYAGKNTSANGNGGATKYVYGDKSGKWDTIKVESDSKASNDIDNGNTGSGSVIDSGSAKESKKPEDFGSKNSSSSSSSSAASSTTKAPSSKTGASTASPTTMSSAVSPGPSSNSTGSPIALATDSADGPKSSGVRSSAARGAVALGSALLAAAGVAVAQLLL